VRQRLNQPALIIFDCDGVLIDSEPITGRVFAEMAQEQGLDWPADEIQRQFLGRAMRECVRIIEDAIGRKLDEQFIDEYRARRNDALRRDLKPTPGLREMLEALDVPYCVASNGEASKMEVTLEVVGIRELFEGRIFSVADVQKPKPAPDLYLHAARVLHAMPERCVVVEDSLTGIEAGVRAGMRVVGYTSAHPKPRLEAAGATLVLDDITRLPEALRDLSQCSG
jgi:HAD superfamily hydrolase (TIGR01509 family)